MKKIGFIGQGWVGCAMAQSFEDRGYYDIVRYSLEAPFAHNKEKIKDCDIVFIAVPTPTTGNGHDHSIVRNVLPLVGNDKIAVIKSTIQPGTTVKLSEEFPNIYVVHSPEFLREKTAYSDSSYPVRNIIGIPLVNNYYIAAAKDVLNVLPKATYTLITKSENAELVKYAGNVFLLMKVLFSNMLYDLTNAVGGQWEQVRDAWTADPRIGDSHTDPFVDGGRGAGGDCFIKDMEAFHRIYKAEINDGPGEKFLKAMKEKNLMYLFNSQKDLDLIEQVYLTKKELDTVDAL